MPAPQLVSPSLVHRATQRTAVVVRAPELASAAPVSRNGEKYILLIASEQGDSAMSVAQARLWLDAGAAFVCAWGPSSQELEESFDYASFLPELGAPFPFTVMTTSHQNEELTEALWFGFYTAFSPTDLSSPLSSVVVLVDSVSLQGRCTEWIKTNRE